MGDYYLVINKKEDSGLDPLHQLKFINKTDLKKHENTKNPGFCFSKLSARSGNLNSNSNSQVPPRKSKMAHMAIDGFSTRQE